MRSKLLLLLAFILLLNLFVPACGNNSSEDIEPETELSSETEETTEPETEPPTEPPLNQYAPDELTVYNIVYKTAPDENHDALDLLLDIYYPTNRLYKKNPVLFVLYGGGWINGDKSSMPVSYKPLFEKLRAEGYAIVAAQYRYASPKFYFPSNLEDCIDSVLFFKNHEEYDIDVNRAGIMGYSAGAHLAMMTSYAMKEFSVSGDFIDMDYCISVSGPTKMYDDDANRYSRATLILVEYLFNGIYEEKPEEYKLGSPYYYMNEGQTTPLMLLQGDNDDVVPYEQSQIMLGRAAECGVPAELLTLEGVGHTVNIVQGINKNPTDAQVRDKIFDFIIAHTKGE